MSAIGPGSLGAISIAGTQAAQKNAKKEGLEAKQASSTIKFQVDQADQVEKASDVSDTDLSQERDADGRQLLRQQHKKNNQDTETQTLKNKPTQPDAFGETGTILNLDV